MGVNDASSKRGTLLPPLPSREGSERTGFFLLWCGGICSPAVRWITRFDTLLRYVPQLLRMRAAWREKSLRREAIALRLCRHRVRLGGSVGAHQNGVQHDGCHGDQG